MHFTLNYIYKALLYVWRSLLRIRIITMLDTSKKFDFIYKYKYWSDPLSKRSVSGYGSDELATKQVIPALTSFIKEQNISSILDLPCGDFVWMRHIDLSGIQYLGGDIVGSLILQNQDKYGNKNIKFTKLNLIEDNLPKVDLVIVRDCFIHFSNNDVARSIENIKKSGSMYLATTSFQNLVTQNNDIKTGDFRFIDLTIPPFNLADPFVRLDDGFFSKGQEYLHKKLSVWKIVDI